MKITKYEGRTYVCDVVFSYLMKDVCQRNHPVNETISCVCHTLRVNCAACVILCGQIVTSFVQQTKS